MSGAGGAFGDCQSKRGLYEGPVSRCMAERVGVRSKEWRVCTNCNKMGIQQVLLEKTLSLIHYAALMHVHAFLPIG